MTIPILGSVLWALIASLLFAVIDRKFIRHAVAKTLFTKEKRDRLPVEQRKGAVTLQSPQTQLVWALGFAVALTVYWHGDAANSFEQLLLFLVKLATCWATFFWSPVVVPAVLGAFGSLFHAMEQAQAGNSAPAGEVAAAAGQKLSSVRQMLSGGFTSLKNWWRDVKDFQADEKVAPAPPPPGAPVAAAPAAPQSPSDVIRSFTAEEPPPAAPASPAGEGGGS